MAQQKVVRALYHEGRLQLLEPVDLPEGVELQITIPVMDALEPPVAGPISPTRALYLYR
jgi:predicted DNA-binding antitoxin AbrB/MazE fold protein